MQHQKSWAACRPTTNLVGCTIWQLAANCDALSRMESRFVVKPAAAPRGLLNHRMSPLGVPMHQLAGPGLVEPLYGSLVRLHFRHGFYPLTHGNTVVLPNEGCYHNRDRDAHIAKACFLKPGSTSQRQISLDILQCVRNLIAFHLRMAYFQRTMLG